MQISWVDRAGECVEMHFLLLAAPTRQGERHQQMLGLVSG
jgi:hypothetical protein